jgi:hypothetical protein
MADIELVNLVTTRLIQEKKEVTYQLKSLVGESPSLNYQKLNQVELITDTLDRYSKVINQITLWESLLDEMTDDPIIVDNKEDKEN